MANIKLESFLMDCLQGHSSGENMAELFKKAMNFCKKNEHIEVISLNINIESEGDYLSLEMLYYPNEHMK